MTTRHMNLRRVGEYLAIIDEVGMRLRIDRHEFLRGNGSVIDWLSGSSSRWYEVLQLKR
jgi:hypothetical protein